MAPERPRRGSAIFLPTSHDNLTSISEGIATMEQTLDSLESAMQEVNFTVDEALELLRAQRGLKTMARLDPLPTVTADAPSKGDVSSDGKGWEEIDGTTA